MLLQHCLTAHSTIYGAPNCLLGMVLLLLCLRLLQEVRLRISQSHRTTTTVKAGGCDLGLDYSAFHRYEYSNMKQSKKREKWMAKGRNRTLNDRKNRGTKGVRWLLRAVQMLIFVNIEHVQMLKGRR
uniref:Secreted protein n=1 Tax=Panagrellus redivivus TaxID=6233 RepID=A0A7E4VT01_PANRE